MIALLSTGAGDESPDPQSEVADDLRGVVR
jgi:hypothetical protein